MKARRSGFPLLLGFHVVHMLAEDRVELFELQLDLSQLLAVLARPVHVAGGLVKEFYQILLRCHNGKTLPGIQVFCKSSALSCRPAWKITRSFLLASRSARNQVPAQGFSKPGDFPDYLIGRTIAIGVCWRDWPSGLSRNAAWHHSSVGAAFDRPRMFTPRSFASIITTGMPRMLESSFASLSGFAGPSFAYRLYGGSVLSHGPSIALILFPITW